MNKQTKRRLLLIAAFAALTVRSALAQDERDALRFSFLQPQGTARSIGFGSALGSVGGDFTSLSVNPAGIGIYRRSEIMGTPSLTFTNTSADYSGNTSEGNASHFTFSNVGIVTTKVEPGRRRQHSGWTTISFGFGLNRLADFTNDYSYEGRNTSSSGSFVYAYDANEFGVSSSGLVVSPADLGYQSYLLDTFSSGGYISVVNPTPNAPVSQRTTVRERGGIGEMALSLGGSYNDKFMLGGTLGIPIVRYLRERTFEERDLSGDNNNDFESFRHYDDLRINGAGINFKAGFIYKPVDNFRFGAAIHTPTYFTLTDVNNQSVTANTENFAGVNTAIALENRYDYNLTTPWRGILSATVMLGGYGFFTIDYEYVDYASAHYSSGPTYVAGGQDYAQYINNLIKTMYQGASNIRTGLEIRLDNIMLRGGFGYYGNPYRTVDYPFSPSSGNPSAERLDFSCGLGFRFENAFLDLGYVHHSIKESEQPYQLPDQAPYLGIVVPTAQLKTGANNMVMTFGFKF